jgi:hypothetical protein
MKRSSWLVLLFAAFLFAGCRQLTDSLHRATQAPAPDLFGSEVIAHFVRDVEARVGAPLRVLDLEASGGQVRFQVQDPKKPEDVNQYELLPKGLQGPQPVQVLGSGSLAGSLYPIAEVDLTKIPAFTRAALAELGIEGATPTSLRIRKELPADSIARRLRGEQVAPRILVRLYADSARKKGMVDADSHFHITKVTVF